MNNFDPLKLLEIGCVPEHKWAVHIRIPKKWYTSKNELIEMNAEKLTDWIFNLNKFVNIHADRSHRLIRASAFQLEKGEKGNLHYQITLFLTKKIYTSDIRKEWKMGSSATKFYIKEVEDPVKSLVYCTKSKTREAGPYFTYDDQNTIDRCKSLPVNAVSRQARTGKAGTTQGTPI